MFRIFCLFRILKKKNFLKDVWYNEVSRPPLCVIEPDKFELNAKTDWQT
jgi:hypothetical protein